MKEVEFTCALLAETTFSAMTLIGALGLADCTHRARSSLDYHTLMESGAPPESFLRGCGLSNEFICYLPSFQKQPWETYSCFISYSHADKDFARRLHDTLQARGIRCWLDERQLLPGDQIHRAIDEAVRLWDKVLLCCSEAALTSWWVDKEIQKALQKEEQLWRERGTEVLAIIPLNLDEFLFKPEWQDWKRQHLTTRLAGDFTELEASNGKFEAQVELVAKALRVGRGARVPAPKPKL